MKLFKYIWRNAMRNKLRTSLTILSVGFSLALMTVLYGYLAMQRVWGNESKLYNRIVVMNKQGFSGKIPIAYVDYVRRMDGIKAAVPFAWYGGQYKEEKMPFAQFATDPNEVFNVWAEYVIPPDQLSAWQHNRQGCVVDRRLAEQRGWKVGEKIPLQGTYYPFDLQLELVGIFDTPQPIASLWFDWKYLDEGLRNQQAKETGNAGTVFAKANSAAVIPGLCAAIDDHYASSDNPTRTQTEAAFAQIFQDMLGNIQAYIRNIGLAVMFSLTLVAANAMAMSMRERTTEVAVLKAIGFSRARVLNMVLGESCFISALGGVMGLAVGGGFLQLLYMAMPQVIPFSFVDMAGPWMLGIVGAAIGIGFVSGVVPAVRAAQLSVIDGLRRVV
ncbi:MAG: ABC transporter permease [Pirellulales bacterium]